MILPPPGGRHDIALEEHRKPEHLEPLTCLRLKAWTQHGVIGPCVTAVR